MCVETHLHHASHRPYQHAMPTSLYELNEAAKEKRADTDANGENENEKIKNIKTDFNCQFFNVAYRCKKHGARQMGAGLRGRMFGVEATGEF